MNVDSRSLFSKQSGRQSRSDTSPDRNGPVGAMQKKNPLRILIVAVLLRLRASERANPRVNCRPNSPRKSETRYQPGLVRERTRRSHSHEQKPRHWLFGLKWRRLRSATLRLFCPEQYSECPGTPIRDLNRQQHPPLLKRPQMTGLKAVTC